MKQSDEYYMQQALREAEKAFEKGEVPIGAVLVMQDRIIVRTHNQVELLKDPTAHAEVLAITAACDQMGAKYLPEATLYITLEPCLMCSGALYWSKIGRIVFGATDPKNGYGNKVSSSPFHPKTELQGGLLAQEALNLMQQFFKNRR
ncbi:tRNA(adenine34) deaminase [Arachidicoccus rhizosphaerae]|uniref:tRNA-specific adenosine deaminase n=1 Tax=Arachidicoccus rhizosphaerae TaxID=551991 RepID=A0A1H3XF12_9BACT|nr:nucleoside deaminase [Arachidicoccus rhizosphaerae]SDZ97138.1 tRNA(adenine34) deaminase [Arachidicoccus rhizosphaerae]